MNDVEHILLTILCALTFCATICLTRVLAKDVSREVTRLDSALRSIKQRLVIIRISYLNQEGTRLLREEKYEEVKYVDDLIEQEFKHLNGDCHENK